MPWRRRTREERKKHIQQDRLDIRQKKAMDSAQLTLASTFRIVHDENPRQATK